MNRQYLSLAIHDMPQNIEIKALLPNPSRVREIAEQIGEDRGISFQEDTYFASPKGRLKLRHLSLTQGELIYYERPDNYGPKKTDYSISITHDPDGLRRLLSEALGVEGVVRKKRHLYLVGQTRIHVDEVEGLGNFLELEVILQDRQKPGDGMIIANELMGKLGVRKEDLVAEAYIDLIKHKNFR